MLVLQMFSVLLGAFAIRLVRSYSLFWLVSKLVSRTAACRFLLQKILKGLAKIFK
jgi:hypothetical protein